MTVYVDPETWMDRLYDPAEPDTHSAAVEPEPEPDDGAVEADMAEDDGDEHERAEQPEREPRPHPRWRIRRQPQQEPDAKPVFTKRISTPAAAQASSLTARRKRRLAATAYTGTAAVTGWGVGLVTAEEQWLNSSAVAPAGWAALWLAGAAGCAAWGCVRRITMPRLMRPLVAAAATAAGSKGGTPLVHALAVHGVHPAAVMPLVTGLVLCGASWRIIDRRTRHWWPPLAWLMRVPSASAALALALYH